jgi:hypothetical protein
MRKKKINLELDEMPLDEFIGLIISYDFGGVHIYNEECTSDEGGKYVYINTIDDALELEHLGAFRWSAFIPYEDRVTLIQDCSQSELDIFVKNYMKKLMQGRSKSELIDMALNNYAKKLEIDSGNGQ